MRKQTRAGAFRSEVTGSSVELGYAGINTFLKANQKDIGELQQVDTAVLGIPYDGAVSNRPGTRYGPEGIRRASGWWAYLSDYKGELTNIDTGQQVNFDDLNIADCGDAPVFPMNVDKTARSITAHVATLSSQALPVILGGDHYCTFPALQGFAEGTGHESVGFVQIDAHTDTVSESPVFGEKYHGSSTELIANSEYTDYSDVSQIGIRGYESAGFLDFVDETGLNLYTMEDIRQQGITSVVEKAISNAAVDTDAVYVSFDIDAIDPGVAPGTGTPVPGGLTAGQALKTMEILGRHNAFGALDLMEVAPRYDSTEGTERLAAYLIMTALECHFLE